MRDLNTSYALEAQGGVNAPVSGSGEGFGGGTGSGSGTGRPDGLTHRLNAFYGITPWMSLGMEQTFRQADFRDFQVGVLAPQLRFRFLLRWPVEVGAFLGSQLRFNAPRSSTAVPGVSLERSWSRLVLATNVGFETSYATSARENGMRYDAGLSYHVTGRWSLALEYWGVLTWSEVTTFRHEHHLSPLAKLRFGAAWVALGALFATQDRALVQYGYGGQLQLGWAFNL